MKSILKVIENLIFFKYVVPFMIIILLIFLAIAMGHKQSVASNVDKDKSILYTDFKSNITEIAESVVDSSELSLTIVDTNSYDVELKYIPVNKDYTAQEYEDLLKKEITKVYERIKEKQLINDTLFGEDENLNNVEICFAMMYEDYYNKYIGGVELKYSTEDMWESGYQNAINENIISQEKLETVKK
jgi:hypothetical protein